MKESILAVQKAIDEQDIDGIGKLVNHCLEEGISPEEVIQEGISKGLEIVGGKFETGEYYLADLIMAEDPFKVVREAIKGIRKIWGK